MKVILAVLVVGILASATTVKSESCWECILECALCAIPCATGPEDPLCEACIAALCPLCVPICSGVQVSYFQGWRKNFGSGPTLYIEAA